MVCPSAGRQQTIAKVPTMNPSFVIASLACGFVRACYCRCCRSELAPTRLAPIHQLELDRRDSEETDDGRLVRVLLDAVIMRGPPEALDEASPGNGNRVSRIETGAAVSA